MLYNMYTSPKDGESREHLPMFAHGFAHQGKEGRLIGSRISAYFLLFFDHGPFLAKNWETEHDPDNALPRAIHYSWFSHFKRVCCCLWSQITSLLSFASAGDMTLRKGKEKRNLRLQNKQCIAGVMWRGMVAWVCGTRRQAGRQADRQDVRLSQGNDWWRQLKHRVLLPDSDLHLCTHTTMSHISSFGVDGG